MKIDIPEINPKDAQKAMELAKSLFAKYNVTIQDQDLLYHAIMTMGIASMINTRNDEMLKQLGIKF